MNSTHLLPATTESSPMRRGPRRKDHSKPNNNIRPLFKEDIAVNKLSPFLKWAGGKTEELRHIMPLVPTFNRYFEPFVGGGAVFFTLAPQHGYINDASAELMGLYDAIAHDPQRLSASLHRILAGWDTLSSLMDTQATTWIDVYTRYSRGEDTHTAFRAFVASWIAQQTPLLLSLLQAPLTINPHHFIVEIERNLRSKTGRMKKIETQKGSLPPADIVGNIECALKSAFYMHCRWLYNHRLAQQVSQTDQAALFFFVRENAYASMFRYNSQGEFNVPYGGMSYNRKDIARKVRYMISPAMTHLLGRTLMASDDFEVFLRAHQPTSDDFLFIDPPYDSDFSTYAGRAFTLADHSRLATYLIDECPSRFMAIIKNTPAIYALYSKPGIQLRLFDKTYMVSFQDRNDRQTEHLLMTNY